MRHMCARSWEYSLWWKLHIFIILHRIENMYEYSSWIVYDWKGSSSGTFYSTYYTKCVADWLLLLDFRGCTLFYAPKYMIAKETSFLNCLRMLRAYTVFSFWHNEIRIYQGIYAKWHTCSIWYGLMPTTIEYVLYKKTCLWHYVLFYFQPRSMVHHS